ncbi:MAG: Hsp20 family protein [bacterium]|nr:Hsp20 family protein [bacterium]
MKEIEIRLRDLRKEHNLSQEELASNLGVSRQSIISLERGEYLPSLPLIIDLVKFFEIPFDEIVCCEGIRIEKGGEIEMAREITPWSPFREVNSLHDAIDRMFDDTLATSRISPMPAVTPPSINLRETDKSIIAEVELPGVKDEDIDVEISEDSITITGEKKTEQEIKEKDYYRKEFSYGSFARTIPLPVVVISDKAEAKLKEGVLTVEVPKAEAPKAKAKKIQIKRQ